jgi:hypothetical protein
LADGDNQTGWAVIFARFKSATSKVDTGPDVAINPIKDMPILGS